MMVADDYRDATMKVEVWQKTCISSRISPLGSNARRRFSPPALPLHRRDGCRLRQTRQRLRWRGARKHGRTCRCQAQAPCRQAVKRRQTVRAFELVTATDSRHAVALLAEHGPSARILAGGTDLLVELKSAPDVPRVIVDISRAEDMKVIAVTDEGLSIGAWSRIARSCARRSFAICSRPGRGGAHDRRRADPKPGHARRQPGDRRAFDGQRSHVDGARGLVTVAGPAGRRQMPLAEFFVGPRKTILKPNELLLEIVIPSRNRQAGALPEIRPAQGTGTGTGQRCSEPAGRLG